jgi:hypothetical protein
VVMRGMPQANNMGNEDSLSKPSHH